MIFYFVLSSSAINLRLIWFLWISWIFYSFDLVKKIGNSRSSILIHIINAWRAQKSFFLLFYSSITGFGDNLEYLTILICIFFKGSSPKSHKKMKRKIDRERIKNKVKNHEIFAYFRHNFSAVFLLGVWFCAVSWSIPCWESVDVVIIINK